MLRQGNKKQEEKQISYWTRSGKIKVFDTAERLREITQEKKFALLILNNKAELHAEYIFDSQSLIKQIQNLIRQYVDRKAVDSQRIKQMCESVKLSAKIKVNQEGKVFRFASYIVPN